MPAVPACVLQCLRLLRGLTAVRCPSNELLVGKRWPTVNPNAAAIIMDLQATAMVSHAATPAPTSAGCSMHSRIIHVLMHSPGMHCMWKMLLVVCNWVTSA
jgi:hypothetical protein